MAVLVTATRMRLAVFHFYVAKLIFINILSRIFQLSKTTLGRWPLGEWRRPAAPWLSGPDPWRIHPATLATNACRTERASWFPKRLKE